MSYPDENRVALAGEAVPVIVRNLPPPQVEVRPTKTVVKTYVLDPTNINGPSQIQICAYEPTRLRLLIQNWEASIAVLFGAAARTSPDSSTVQTGLGEGGYLTANDGRRPWEFFGMDAVWINSLGTITRVTVLKEYE